MNGYIRSCIIAVAVFGVTVWAGLGAALADDITCGDSQAGPGTFMGSFAMPASADSNSPVVMILLDNAQAEAYISQQANPVQAPADVAGLVAFLKGYPDMIKRQNAITASVTSARALIVNSSNQSVQWACRGVSAGTPYAIFVVVASTWTWTGPAPQNLPCFKTEKNYYLDRLTVSAPVRRWIYPLPYSDFTLLATATNGNCPGP
jgi:hypothetical protein